MTTQYVVVDGSNIATEGRSLPSLRQLDEAVRAFLAEHPADQLTVVVDATFGHRIDASERAEYEAAVLAGELVSPPAGAIGRGDAFVLQIADKANAVILSNDSFQEFHGQYSWLFDEGRLIGGKPVPGLGWVFLFRTPVRGPASRRSVKEARSGRRSASEQESSGSGRTRGRAKADSGRADKTKNDTRSKSTGTQAGRGASTDRSTRRRPNKPADALNDLLPFVDFVHDHPVGSEVEAIVDTFSSHGAYAMVGDVRCYIPLKAMGEPAPVRARDVLDVGETCRFTVSSVDAPRRGIDLALVDSDKSRRRASGDLVTAPLPQGVPIGTVARPVSQHARKKASTREVRTATHLGAIQFAEEAPVTPAKKAAAKKAPAKKAPARKAAAKKAPARKAPAKKAVAKKAPARKAVAKKAPARKTAAKKAPARKTAGNRLRRDVKGLEKKVATAVAKKRAARKTAAKKAPARKTAAKKAPARKAAAKKAPARKTAAKKAPARKAAARKAPARKAPARKTAARKAPARKTAARKAPARRR